MPYVVIERPMEIDESYSFVSSNNYQSGLLPGKYLIENGHKILLLWNGRAESM